MNIKLGPPTLTDLKPRITVIGIGGAGCNAINNMIATKLDGVEFVVANTDAQSLSMSNAERRIQLGTNLTEGLGAGARPEVGEAAAREAEEDIRAEIAGSHMVFIAAGMGGGTGTGAATVIAEIARDLGILTVGIVSKPFQFEGARRMRTADAGIDALERVVDTLIVIPNQNLFRIANERTTFAEAFRLADQVLYSGIACIVDLIVKEGLINLDFADVQAVMKGMGTAMMGTGEATGEDRALTAANEAIANPLLDNISLSGAQGLLISIVGGADLTLYEVDTAASHIRKEVAADANIIVGATTEEGMNESIRVSIVASGLMGAASPDAGRSDTEEASGGYGSTSYRGPESGAASPPRPQKSDVSRAAVAATPATAAVVSSSVTTNSQGGETADEYAADDDASDYDADYDPGQTLADAYGSDEDQSAKNMTPPSPPPVSNEMGADDADEFARALSEAMEEALPTAHDAEEMGAWHSADGVLIEEGFSDPSGGAVAPPPLPAATRGQSQPTASPNEGFEPVQPAQVRRNVPRMPDVSDFPEMAQREYFAKMEAAEQGRESAPASGTGTAARPRPSASSDADRGRRGAASDSGSGAPTGAATHVEPPAARPGLLRRLTGARK